ncbi:MAG: zinc ribbon domain-containing protein, partial [Streptosporangiaceae bacterium]
KILDVDTWRKLQAEMDRKATKKGAVRAGSPMLGGVAVCHKCGGPMYKLRAQNVRRDGTKQYNVYYRCFGTATQPSTCHNMYPLDELDAWAEMRMARIKFPRYEIVVTPGHGHEDAVYEVERRKTGDTIGQYWATLETDDDKRAFLMKLGVVIRVRRGETREADHIFLELGDGMVDGGAEFARDDHPAAN